MERRVQSNDKVLLDEPNVRVLYDQNNFMGKVIWAGNPTKEQYRNAFLTLLNYARDGHKITKFLSDTRRQGIINPENRKWFEKEMVPQAIEAGLERAAVITSGNAFKVYYLNLILGAVNKFNMPFKIFTSEEKAIGFLLEP